MHTRHVEQPTGAQIGPLLRYELTPIADLQPAPRNARKHSKAQIVAPARSIKQFGTISPVIRDSDNRIVGGHGRVEAAKMLGLGAVPTLLVDHLTPAQVRLFALADNSIAEQASWDEPARAQEFLELRIEVRDIDLTLSGFAHTVIELAIAGLDQSNWSDLDACPEEPLVSPVTQIGDIFDFPGGHCLVCGDSSDPAAVTAVVGSDTGQRIAQDAPYNRKASEYSGKGRFKHDDFAMGAGEMSTEEFRAFLASNFAAVKPHLADGALIYAFMDGLHVADLIEAGSCNRFEIKTVLVGDKGSAGLGAMYRSAHELIVLFKHGRAPHLNNIAATRGQGRDRQTIWRYPGLNRFGKRRERALAWHANHASLPDQVSERHVRPARRERRFPQDACSSPRYCSGA